MEGPVTLDAVPTRVVSVGQFRDTDAAVALGIVPLATPDIGQFIPGSVSPWLREKLAGQAPPEAFRIVDGLPLERIAGLRPDRSWAPTAPRSFKDYAKLAAIAPTLSTEAGYNKDTRQVTTTRVGKLLGRSDPAAALIAQVEGAIAAARADHPVFAGRMFTIGPVQADGTVTTINSATDASAVFLSQLGLTLSPAVTGLATGPIPGRAPISPERLGVLDADVLILTFNTRRRSSGWRRTRCSSRSRRCAPAGTSRWISRRPSRSRSRRRSRSRTR